MKSSRVISLWRNGLAQMFLQTEDFNLMPTWSSPTATHTSAQCAVIIRYWRLIGVALLVLYGFLLAAFVLPLCSRQSIARHTRKWSQRLLKTMAVQVEVENILSLLPLPGNIVVLNHISWLDVFVLNSFLPSRFVTKSDVRQWPLLGLMCQQAGCLFLQRGQARAVERMNEQLRTAIGAGDVVALFPEGTTTAGNTMKPFKPALFQAAVDSGSAVIPVALSYRDGDCLFTSATAYVGEMTLIRSIINIVSQQKTIARLRVLPALPSHSVSRNALAQQAHHAIYQSLF